VVTKILFLGYKLKNPIPPPPPQKKKKKNPHHAKAKHSLRSWLLHELLQWGGGSDGP
jgi:hypothetical protein